MIFLVLPLMYCSTIIYLYPLYLINNTFYITQCNIEDDTEYYKGNDVFDIWFDSGISWAAVIGEGMCVGEGFLIIIKKILLLTNFNHASKSQ